MNKPGRGEEVLRDVRQTAKLAAPPVLATTAYVDSLVMGGAR